MNITIRQLRYFVALAETGGFGIAATRVNISQPALSLQIKELEAACDARLVERLPRNLQLTPAGQLMLRHARRVLAEMTDLEQALRWRDGLSGRLNLGVIPTVAPYILPQALTRIRGSDLTLDIRVREAQTEKLVVDLLSGKLDAALMAMPVVEDQIATMPLFEDRFLLAGSDARLAQFDQAGGLATPQSLRPDQLLLLDEGHCLADQALEVCGLAGRRPSVDLGASSLSTLCGLVAEGFGLTLLPEISLPAETAATQKLSLRRFTTNQPSRQIALCYRAQSTDDEWVSTLAKLFCDAAAEVLDQAARIA